MSSILGTPPPEVEKDNPHVASSPIPPVAAWLMALGSFLSLAGFGWDLQWHGDVGPDTFFTFPHLFIYAGSALVGLTCLVMSLRILNATRTAGGRLSLNPIPRPFLIAGFGTAIFLVCGLWDEWWHSIYGFDVTIMSPPHIGLLTCIQIGMVGTIAAFASVSYGTNRTARPTHAGTRAAFRPEVIGLAFVAACSASFLVFFGGVAAFIPAVGIGIDPVAVYQAMVFVVAMMVAAAATRTRFAASMVAVSVLLIKTVFEMFSIAATDWYAESLGLFIRDEALAFGRISSFASALPSWVALLAAGIVIDALLAFGIRRKLPGRLVVATAGALSGVVVGINYWIGAPAQLPFAAPSSTTVIAFIPIGALAALVAWQLGNLARVIR